MAALLFFFPALGGIALGIILALGIVALVENGLTGLYQFFFQWDLKAVPNELPFNLYLFVGLMAILGMVGLRLGLMVWKWGVVKSGLLSSNEWAEFDAALNKYGLLRVWKKVPKDHTPPG